MMKVCLAVANEAKGFSLLEALIGVLLLTLVGSTALRCFHNAQSQVAHVRYAEDAQRAMAALLQQVALSKQIPRVPRGKVTVRDGSVAWTIVEKRFPTTLWSGDISRVIVQYTLDNGDEFTLHDYFGSGVAVQDVTS